MDHLSHLRRRSTNAPRVASTTRGTWIAAVVVTASCLTAVVWLHRHGTLTRRYAHGGPEPTIRVVSTTAEMYELWRSSNVHGRRLVYLSRYFHFMAASDSDAFLGRTSLGFATFDMVARAEQHVSARSVLWVAMQRGIAREIQHVLQPAELQRRIAIGAGAPGVSVRGRTILATEFGSPRVGRDDIPSFDEPVVVGVDASYLDSDAAAYSALGDLRKLLPHTDLLVLCRSDDNSDVLPKERQRLDWLAGQLEARQP